MKLSPELEELRNSLHCKPNRKWLSERSDYEIALMRTPLFRELDERSWQEEAGQRGAALIIGLGVSGAIIVNIILWVLGYG